MKLTRVGLLDVVEGYRIDLGLFYDGDSIKLYQLGNGLGSHFRSGQLTF